MTAPSRLLIYSDRGGVYGAEQINHRLALALQAHGLAITLAHPETDNHLVAQRAARGIGQHWLPNEDPYDLRHPAPSLTDPGAGEQCLAATRPDLILFADSFPFANLAAKQAATRLGVPYLTLVHCVQPDWAEQYRVHLPALAAAFAGAIEVIAVSTENRDLLRQRFGLPARTGRVIYNGRPEVFFAPSDTATRRRVRAVLGIPSDAVVALSIGRLELAKGWQHLIDALRLLRGCPHWGHLQLVWVGSGTLEDRVRRVSALLGQGRVQLLAERDDVPDLLDAADLLVHPAQFEGMPLVVLEAMAKGLPIIATAVSGIPEALGDTGVLLEPPGDPRSNVQASTPGNNVGFSERLAAALCALAGSEPRRQQLGAAAHQRALAKFTEERMADEYLALVRRTLGG